MKRLLLVLFFSLVVIPPAFSGENVDGLRGIVESVGTFPLDVNANGKVNGEDWVLYSTNEKMSVVSAYLLLLHSESDFNVENASWKALTSLVVELVWGVEQFYKNYKNRKVVLLDAIEKASLSLKKKML